MVVFLKSAALVVLWGMKMIKTSLVYVQCPARNCTKGKPLDFAVIYIFSNIHLLSPSYRL